MLSVKKDQRKSCEKVRVSREEGEKVRESREEGE